MLKVSLGLGAPASMGRTRVFGRALRSVPKPVAKPPPLPKTPTLSPSDLHEVGSKEYLHAAIRSPKGSDQRRQAMQHGAQQFLNKQAAFAEELWKIAEWDSKKFREGLVDEGIPLAGATIGARYGGLRGAALGYAAGGTASLARSYAKGEKPSMSRKLLAAGALGYGAGGGAHALLEHASKGAKAGKGILGQIRHAFHTGKGSSPKLRRTVEEALPAAGATLATGIAMGTSGKKDKEKKAMSGAGAAVRAVRPPVHSMIAGARQAAFGAGRPAMPAARRVLQGNPTNFVPPTPAGGSSWANNPRAISL